MQLLPDSEPGKNNVVYTAYEPYPGEGENKPFKLYTDFKDINAGKRRFHVVVLMNVLHEIEAGQWEQTFQDIINALLTLQPDTDEANKREYKVRRTNPDDNKRQIKIRVDGIRAGCA